MSIITDLNNTIGNPAAASSSTAAAKAANSTVDASSLLGTTDQFLTILLAQLKHQDPLEPMKGTEFIDSISRLSGVEQSINTNKHLESITDLLKGANSQTGNPVSYIDKTIDFNSSQVALSNHLAGFSYDLDATNPPSKVNLTIKDANGKVVVNTFGTNKAGTNVVKWDGTDNDGNQQKDGLYTITVSYPDPKDADKPDAEKEAIILATYTTGKVTEADFTGTEPTLKVGGVQIPLTAIRKLYGSSS